DGCLDDHTARLVPDRAIQLGFRRAYLREDRTLGVKQNKGEQKDCPKTFHISSNWGRGVLRTFVRLVMAKKRLDRAIIQSRRSLSRRPIKCQENFNVKTIHFWEKHRLCLWNRSPSVLPY